MTQVFASPNEMDAPRPKRLSRVYEAHYDVTAWAFEVTPQLRQHFPSQLPLKIPTWWKTRTNGLSTTDVRWVLVHVVCGFSNDFWLSGTDMGSSLGRSGACVLKVVMWCVWDVSDNIFSTSGKLRDSGSTLPHVVVYRKSFGRFCLAHQSLGTNLTVLVKHVNWWSLWIAINGWQPIRVVCLFGQPKCLAPHLEQVRKVESGKMLKLHVRGKRHPLQDNLERARAVFYFCLSLSVFIYIYIYVYLNL